MLDIFYDLGDIYLRGICEEDLDGDWYKWFNNSDVTKYQDKKIYPNTKSRQKKYYDYLQTSTEDVVFAIVLKKTNTHIGNIGLHKINYVHRRAEVGIVIGDLSTRGCGYGKKAVQTITSYAFDVLNLHSLMAIIMEQNKSSLSIFESVGFASQGVLLDYFYKNGTYINAQIVCKIKKE